MNAIAVAGLGKAYKHYPSRWGRLAEWLVPFHRQRHELRWVLQDINLAVRSGCALGIVGINGAGKSTLLKMITGTTQATARSIQVVGKIAALLELGLGFHPDFTGRQNATMAGQLLGWSAEDSERLMPAVESFAEIGDYIDQPVRVYSSGMQMRLAFSVATARRPDVLIVDEALSVGDAYFQHKSFERIRSFRAKGTALLLVSHDKAAIQSICDEAILLDAGKVAMRGKPEAVMDYYNALIAQREAGKVHLMQTGDGRIQTVSGTGEATVSGIRLINASANATAAVAVGESVSLEIAVTVNRDIPQLILGYMIKDRLGQPVFGTNTYHLGHAQQAMKAGQQLTLQFDFRADLGEGSYSIATALADSQTHMSRNYEWRDLALVFQVVNQGVPPFVGTTYLPTRAKILQCSQR